MKRFLLLLLVCISFPHSSAAADFARHMLQGHVPSWATPETDQGSAAPDLQLNNLVVVLKRSDKQEAAFREFLVRQQEPRSSDYHHWLTSTEIGERFGPASRDIARLTKWLESAGLRVDGISNSRMFVGFSGPADSVSAAFGSELHYYRSLASQTSQNRTKLAKPLLSIGSEPTIPASLAHLVAAISGLSELPTNPSAEGRPLPKTELPRYSACFTGNSCQHYIAPADFATIFDVNPLYKAGINGSGQSIAIIGRSRVVASDIQGFELDTGLTSQIPNIIIPPTGTDPGTTGDGAQLEATLDVERAVGTAPGATIDLIVSGNSATQDGLYISAVYAVDVKMDSVLSISFGACESGRSSGVSAFDTLAQQAVGEGISVFVISGDAGAAGCDTYGVSPPATQTASPNYICASSYITCVGGTEFNDTANPSLYWTSSNATSLSSALGYIPEGAWNEPTNLISGAYQIASSGGGPSMFIAKPSWQTGPGVPNDGHRDTPDVSFPASQHDAYYGCLAFNGGNCNTGQFEYFYGTSSAAPTMAGVAALINQKLGGRQGNLNPSLYQLAVNYPNVFHDTTVASSGITNCSAATPSICNNSTPSPSSLTGGLAGYVLTNGYDMVTGLGSIDVANLVNALTPVQGFALSNSGPITVTAGAVTGNTVTITVTPSGGLSGSISLTCGLNTVLATTPTNSQYLPTCTVPPALTLSGTSPVTATLTVLTTAASSTHFFPPIGFPALGIAAAILCACLIIIPRRRRTLTAGVLFGAIVCAVGCGPSSTTTTTVTHAGTTAGPYTITVTGVSGTITQTTPVTINVN